jgi:acetyl esterase/lipase
MRVSLSAVLLVCLSIASARLAAETKVTRDIEFARVGDKLLKLDLHVPSGEIKTPLVVYVHGGAWKSGLKDDMPLEKLVEQGYVIASVDYRVSLVAPFPAQIHDIKAAIRFLRAKGRELGVDSSRIVMAGSSAGGHLAALTGVSNGVKELEGTVGTNLTESSAVHGIISLYGASNLETILSQSTPKGVEFRRPAMELLLGGPVGEKAALAKLAGPVNHVDANDPPLLLIHGDADPQMPYAQSEELKRLYEKTKLRVELETIRDGKHGGDEFYDDKRTDLMAAFLKSLTATPAAASSNPKPEAPAPKSKP